ncbi:spore coat protein [Bacillus sp. BGMRC 2118]|nr:spore coat protein [Bacillus sp. BGMRC 2118]
MKLKKGIKEIEDTELKGIYTKSIHELETSLKELMYFYPYAPKPGDSNDYRNDNGFHSGDLLAFTKSGVRNYAVAITETASPQLRVILTKQLNVMTKLHEQIFMYMYKKGLYPAYDLRTLLEQDVTLAHKALSM